jgi:Tfp pilus assembly protein PilO
MRGWSLLSARERTIFIVVTGVLVVLFFDFACRAWGAAIARVGREEQQLKKQWEYTSGLLARSQSIEERYNDIRSRFPGLFDGTMDRTRIMAELDEVARAAGIQVSMLKPVQGEAGGSSRIELALCGAWPQVLRFFRAAEGQERMFQFSEVSVHRQERTGELEVSAVAQK